jgi:hypothetical protein
VIDQAAALSPAQRIARIAEECASPLGYAQRGVSSWDQLWLEDIRGRHELEWREEVRLREIEHQVFG